MATNLNRVCVTGRLSRDIDLRHTKGGTAVCNLSLAVNGREKINGEWTETTAWVNVTVWAQSAENCAKYLGKGSRVAVEGKLRTEEFEKDGQKRQSLVVVAETVEFLDSKPQSDSDSRRPSGNSGSNQGGGGGRSAPDQGGSYSDDDVPFAAVDFRCF